MKPEPEAEIREVVTSEIESKDGDQVSEDIQDAGAESKIGAQSQAPEEPEREPAPEPSTPETEPERFILPRVVSIANQKRWRRQDHYVSKSRSLPRRAGVSGTSH